jgi:hypothetical protein
MRADESESGEVQLERRGQFFPVPAIGAKELVIVLAGLVPARQERAGEVEPFAVPAL